jgi:hypothetical protein
MRRFPRRLSRRLRRHFRELYDTKVSVDEEAILSEMTSDLRIEVSKYLVSELMEDVMPFKDMSSLQWAKVLPLLTPHVFNQHDVLCSQGDYCAESTVVLDGALQGRTSSKQLTCTLSGEATPHNARHRSHGGGNRSQEPPAWDEPLLSPTSMDAWSRSLGLSPARNERTRAQVVKRKRGTPVSPSPVGLSPTRAAASTRPSFYAPPSLGGQSPHSFAGGSAVDSSGGSFLPTHPDGRPPTTPLPQHSSSSRAQQTRTTRSNTPPRRTSPPPPQMNDDDDDLRVRSVGPGTCVNILCLLGVWELAVETVVALAAGQVYVVQTDEFLAAFEKHQVCENRKK